MAEESKIQWTDATFNPWRGCTKVSQGCANCYAEAGSKRNPSVLGTWGPEGTRVVAAGDYWMQPLRWAQKARRAGRPLKVFCASLADVFEDWQGAMLDTDGRELWTRSPLSWEPLPEGYGSARAADRRMMEGWVPLTMGDVRSRLWWTINITAPWLVWQIVTKRPENASRMVPPTWGEEWPRNVWLLTSVENQECADRRSRELLRVPAAVRGFSIEPLLGPVDLSLFGTLPASETPGEYVQVREQIDWVIIGGESGPRARPCHLDWIRTLVGQCQLAQVPVFVKQLGSNLEACDIIDAADYFPGDVPLSDAARPNARVHLRDPKGGDPAEWPQYLRVRGWPRCWAG